MPKRVLKERGAKDVSPALQGWLAKIDAKDAEANATGSKPCG